MYPLDYYQLAISFTLTSIIVFLVRKLVEHYYPQKNYSNSLNVLYYILLILFFALTFLLVNNLIVIIIVHIIKEKESKIRLNKLRTESNNMRNNFIEKARARHALEDLQREEARKLRAIAEYSMKYRNYNPID